MMKTIKYLSIVGVVAFFCGCATTTYQNANQMQPMINKVCNNQKPITITPWSAYNLYDCKTNSWFIPYELWSGAEFSGDKQASKNHQVNNSTQFAYREDKPSKLRTVDIKGAVPWINIKTSENNNIYIRTEHKRDYKKIEYFTFNDIGIGRVFDNKGYQYGLTKSDRYFIGKHIKFPAGYGWKLNEPRTLYGEVNGIERTTTINIKKLGFNKKTELEYIIFDWVLNTKVPEKIEYKYSKDIGLIYQYGGK